MHQEVDSREEAQEDGEEEEEEDFEGSKSPYYGVEFEQNVAIRIRRRLTLRNTVYLSLSKVEKGFTKRMRFSYFVLCPGCGAANHLHDFEEVVSLHPDCDDCNNCKYYVLKTDVFHIYAPIGTRKGSTVLIPDEGSHGPPGIRGDVVVTFLDEPHDHFLRVFDDIIVCFQIDREESVNGVTRLLTLVVPEAVDIVLKTEDGVPVENNEVRYVNDLGLPNCMNPNQRGKLIIVFIVKDKRSMFPVKLKDLRMSFVKSEEGICSEMKVSNRKLRSAAICGLRKANPTIPNGNGLKRNRGLRKPNPRKRKKSALVEDKASTSSDSSSSESDNPPGSSKDVSSPSVRADSEKPHDRCSRIPASPVERLTWSEIKEKDPLDLKKLSFLDRIVYGRTIPLPYKTPVRDAIPMSNLTILWERIFDPSWWLRTYFTQSLPKDPDTLMKKLFPLRRPSISNRMNLFVDVPVFDVEDVKLDEAAEAVKTLITMQSNFNPEYIQFTPPKFTRDEKLDLLARMKEYMCGMLPEVCVSTPVFSQPV